jgi:hypothetical protein
MLRSVVTGRQARGCRGAIATRPKVLVVVRYSPVCRAALELAARLASGLGGELIVLALIPIGVRATGTGGVGMDDRRSVEMDHLDVFVKDVLGARPAVPYEPVIAFALSAHDHVGAEARPHGRRRPARACPSPAPRRACRPHPSHGDLPGRRRQPRDALVAPHDRPSSRVCDSSIGSARFQRIVVIPEVVSAQALASVRASARGEAAVRS